MIASNLGDRIILTLTNADLIKEFYSKDSKFYNKYLI